MKTIKKAKSQSNGRFVPQFLTMVGVAFAITVVTLFLYQRAAVSQQAAPYALPVSVAFIDRQDNYSVREYYTGRVEALQTVDLSFEQPGKVNTIVVDEGSAVKKGDLIATLDTDILQANRSQTLASQKRIEAQLKLAELTEKRQKSLFDQGHSTEQSYDEARLNTETVKAQLAEATAVLRAIDVSLEKSSLYAPFDGMVGQRYLDVGSVGVAGMPIVNLLETSVQQARISVPVSRARTLKTSATQTIIYNDQTLTARVRTVRPDVNVLTRTQDVLFEIQAIEPIPFGELVELRLDDVRAETGYWVPVEALVEGTKGLWNIFVVEAESGTPTVVRRSVAIAHTETHRVYVSADLGGRAQIVASGTHRIVPGQPISVVTKEER